MSPFVQVQGLCSDGMFSASTLHCRNVKKSPQPLKHKKPWWYGGKSDKLDTFVLLSGLALCLTSHQLGIVFTLALHKPF